MKKLAIVGTHTRTREQAPFDDPEYEIWVFNEAPQQAWCKRWDCCFQLHKPEVYRSPNNFVRADHWDWLQEQHGARRIYMQEFDDRVPNSERYPLEEIIASIPGAQLRWFKSTPAYALALALYLGYEHIALYGLDMSSNTEYGYQLPNYQFWVGIAYGLGLSIEMLSNESYFTGSLYAYEGEVQIDRSHFAERAGDLVGTRKRSAWQSAKVRNRLEDAIANSKFDKVCDLIAECQEAILHAGEAAGALDEAKRYMGRDDPIPRQEYERTAAQAQKDAEEARKEMWIAHGETQYVWNIWRQTGNPQAREQLKTFSKKQLKAAEDCGIRSGIMHENMDYMVYVNDLITAAGGPKTLAALGVI
jgi:hypothetical protein